MRLRRSLKSVLALLTLGAFVGVEIYYSFPVSNYSDLGDYFFANGIEEKSRLPALTPLDASPPNPLAVPDFTERFVSLPPADLSAPAGHSTQESCRSPPVLSQA